MRPRSLFRAVSGFILALFPQVTAAQQQQPRFVIMATGIRVPDGTQYGRILTFPEIIGRLLVFLTFTIVTVTMVLFVVGAVYMVASAGNPEPVEKGKKLMKGSLIGMAIVLLSYTIYRTVIYLLYFSGG